MKKSILIMSGIIVIAGAVLSYRIIHLPVAVVAPTHGPELYQFKGFAYTMKNNFIMVNGLFDSNNKLDAKGIPQRQDVTVVMSPNTKIYRRVSPTVKTEGTMIDLYYALKKGPILFQISADRDFHITRNVTPYEVIFASLSYRGEL